MVFASTFSAARKLPRRGEKRGPGGCRERPGQYLSCLCRRGNAGKKKLRLFCMEKDGASMEKSGLHQKDTNGDPQDARRLGEDNKKGGVCTPPSKRSEKPNLLHFDNSAGFGQLLLGFFGFFLAHAFLQGGGAAVDLFLGFLQAQAGQSAHDLDDADLVGAGFL